MKFCHNMQRLQNDCGIAVIKTILEQKKIFSTKNNLKIQLPDDGLSLHDITNYFSKLGLQADAFEVSTFSELKKVDTPYIAMITQNSLSHYIVIHKYDKRNNTFILSNPSSVDIEKVSSDELEQLFLGYIIILDDSGTVQIDSSEFKNEIIESYKMVIDSMDKKDKIELIILLILQFLLPLSFYQLLQNALAENFEHLNEVTIILYLIFYLSFFVGTYLLGIRFSELKLKLENSFQRKIIDDYYFANMSNITGEKNIDNLTGYLSTLMQGSSGLIERFFLGFDILFTIFLIILMFFLHFTFPIIFLGVSLIYGFYTFKQLKKIMNYQQNLATSYNGILTNFESSVNGALDIKIYEREHDAYESLKIQEKKFFNAKYLDAILQNKISSLSSISTFMMIVLVMIVTFISLRFNGNVLYPLSSGLYVFFIVISLIESVIQSFLSYQMSYISIEYVQSIKNFIDNSSDTTTKVELPKVEKLALKKVDFSYDDKPILKKVDFEISSGSSISISGENGTGKTTLTKIILGILTPDCGEILLNDTVVNELHNTNIISQINYYSPEQHLFYSTVSNNVTMDIFGGNNITEYQSIFSQAISKHKLVYQGGSNLSQGQKQKILLDRCFYIEKNIYILDEPSGNLDLKSKYDLINKINMLKEKGKIIILISHDKDLLDICEIQLNLSEGRLTYK